jgi:hypothetical protein
MKNKKWINGEHFYERYIQPFSEYRSFYKWILAFLITVICIILSVKDELEKFHDFDKKKYCKVDVSEYIIKREITYNLLIFADVFIIIILLTELVTINITKAKLLTKIMKTLDLSDDIID